MNPPANAALMPALIPVQAPVKTEDFTFEKLPLKPREVWGSRVTLAQPSHQNVSAQD